MKFFHLSGLHLGKRVNEYLMLEDQAYILDEILGIIREENPDGVMIAGDVYDKAVPSAEAVALFDDFLVKLSKIGTSVFVIRDCPRSAGNEAPCFPEPGLHILPNMPYEPACFGSAFIFYLSRTLFSSSCFDSFLSPHSVSVV